MKLRDFLLASLLVAVTIGALKAAQEGLAPSSTDVGFTFRLTPEEKVLYDFAPTLITWTPQQIRDFPTLHKLRPAASQDLLPMILDRAGETGAAAFQDFPQVSCDEALVSETSGSSKARRQKFRYIVLPRPEGDVWFLDEYRTDPEGNPTEKMTTRDLYMVTSGFASTWLYLSPGERHQNHFRYFGIQTLRNRECYVVGFAQDSERTRRIEGFHAPGVTVALLLQGLAWVDTQTFQIHRVMTWLIAPRPDVDLSSQISTVDFSPVQPIGAQRVLWLPRDVKVWALYRGVSVRNTHQYSNFKLFRVESTIKP